MSVGASLASTLEHGFVAALTVSKPVRNARHRSGRSARAARDLLIVDALVNESRDLKSLTHGVEFIGGADVAQERRDDRGVTQSRERVNQLIKTSGRLGFGICGNHLA